MRFSETYLGKLRQIVGSRLLMVAGGRAVFENQWERSFYITQAILMSGLSGGGAEESESAEGCIVRELFEETGLRLKNFEAIGFASNPKHETVIYPNGYMTQNYCLILHSTDWEGELNDSDPETKDLRFFNLS